MTSTTEGTIRIPTAATLRRYGLSELEWRAIGVRQGWVCCVCRQHPKAGRLVIDHEHVKGWRDMPPAQRKRYVRGLLCWFCNHYHLARAMTEQKAYNVYLYLQDYNERSREIRRRGKVEP